MTDREDGFVRPRRGDVDSSTRSGVSSRMASFAWYAGWISLGLLLVAIVTSDSEASGSSRPELLFFVPATFFGMWALVRFADPSSSVLQVVDVVGFFLSSAFVAAALHLSNRFEFAIPTISHVLILRSAFVPSSGLQTGVVSALGMLPALVFGFLSLAGESDSAEGLTVGSGVGLVVRCMLWPVIATAVSRVIYGLRREVKQARQLGQYILERKIGEGGMGEVYRAKHVLLSRPTAIKLIKSDTVNEKLLRRFEREVEATSRLTHPNTVAVYDFGHTADGVFYYAMEFLPGLDLGSLVRRFGPQSPARVIHFLSQICGSLEEAHAEGIVHRDIKPENLILCERGRVPDVVKVVDFGLAKDLFERGPQLTAEHGVVGTPMYLPPEAMQSSGEVDARSDLFSLGATAYFLLTGRPPFIGKNIVEIAMQQMNATPERPSEIAGVSCPPDLEDLVLACLSPKPTDRPESARRLRAGLADCSSAGDWGEGEARAWWRENLPRGPEPR